MNLRIEASHQSHNLDKYEDPKDAMAHEGREGNMNTIYHKKDKYEEMATGKRIPFTSELERKTKMKEIERPLNPPPLTEQKDFKFIPKVNDKKSPTRTPPLSKTKTGGNKTSKGRKINDRSATKSNTINNTARMILQQDVSELPNIPSPHNKIVDKVTTSDTTMSHNASEDSLTFNSSVMVNRQSTIISFRPSPPKN